jgi:hypothetical protein
MDTDISGEASFAWMQRARALARRLATMDLDELSLLVQLTVGVLLHHAAMRTCRRQARCSNTRYWITVPAISRSEFVMVPVGFINDTTLSRMS